MFTLTPEPTLLPQDAKKNLIALLQNNGGCQFPCLWGFTPDETDSQTMLSSLEKFGKIDLTDNFFVETKGYSDNGNTTIIYWENDLRVYVSLTFGFDTTKSKVNGIHIGVETSRNLYAAYGDPFFSQLLGYYLVLQRKVDHRQAG